jgi:Ras GTPase-activating protein 1
MESNSKNENNIKMNEMNINCFHGRLSRKESELRLRSSQLLNCYLLRESDRKPLSYVLSYLGSNLEINHFRIQYICGNYYFGAKHFSSFQQLIHYYSKISDLLRNQRLIHPISPKEVFNQ